MDGGVLDFIGLSGATFTAVLIAGMAGYVFGRVTAAASLHIPTPLTTAILIIGYGLIVQGMAARG